MIADDHPMMVKGIADALKTSNNINLINTCSNGKEVLYFLNKNKVDVILLDIEMPEMNGIACAKQILKNYTNTKIIIVSMHNEPAMVKSLRNIGVHGYLLKTVLPTQLVNNIEKVNKGATCFDIDVFINNNKKIELPENEKLKQLSKREIEILKLIAKGLTNKEIGHKLFISSRTVDTHRTNLMKKTEIHNVAGLVRFAFQNGLA